MGMPSPVCYLPTLLRRELKCLQKTRGTREDLQSDYVTYAWTEERQWGQHDGSIA